MDNYSNKLQKIEVVLNKNLPKDCNDDFVKNAFGTLPSAVQKKHFAPLVEPCANLIALGGKRWRPLLLVLCTELFANADNFADADADVSAQNKIDCAYQATSIVELVHTASLIHDDIEDGADMRRGKPASHITFGLDTALNAGSWLYFESFASIQNLALQQDTKLQLYALVAEELRRLHLGQAMDISWHRDVNSTPSTKEYEAMVRLKTGTLASLAAKIGAVIGGANLEQVNQLASFAVDIGVGFQVLDDVINLKTGNPGKKRGDDIVEGKKSLPVLLHLETYPQDAPKIAELFLRAKQEGINSSAVEECICLLEKGGCIDKAYLYAKELIAKATSSIQNTCANTSANAKPAKDIAQLFSAMVEKITC